MSNHSVVTRSGQEGTRPGREAITGARRGSPAVRATLPAKTTTSYYGLPVLNAPVWASRDIAGYLFLGGLAGSAAVVGAAAQLTGRRGLARVSKTGAAGAISLSLAALVHDLGRPSRFLHMLRVLKPTSPMSVGSWLLAAFGPAAGLSAVSEVTGRLPRLGAVATAGAAALGPAVAAYTAALISDTAVPSWHGGYREMPFVFVASGAQAAAGLGVACAPASEARPVRRLAAVAATAELAATARMERRMGQLAEPYHEGAAGRLLRAARVCTVGGALGALLSRRHGALAVASGGALLAGSALTRFGIFHAGVASAKDPKYTVAPQRARLAGKGTTWR